MPPRGLLKEDSRLRISWDALQIISGLTTGFTLPFFVLSATTSQSSWKLWILLSAGGAIDIWLQSKTPFETSGELEHRSEEILKHYLKRWFGLDLISNASIFLVPINPILVFLQLLRSSKIFRVLGRWEHLQLFNPLILRISRYSLGMLLLTNWISAIWLAIGLQGGNDSWIYRTGLNNQDFGRQYLMSWYWSVTTMASVGYGDITPKTDHEVITAIVVMGLGVILFAFAIGNVVAFVSQLDDGRAEYKMRQASIRRYLEFNGVSMKTLSRLRQFNDYLWEQSHGTNPDEILGRLPSSIRSEIIAEMLENSVRTVPLFSQAPITLRNRLLTLLRPEFFPPGSIILNQDEPGDEIVFLTHGSARLVTKAEISVEEIFFQKGDYFGDLSFFLKENRNCSVVAESYVEAFLLNRTIFNDIMNRDPRLRRVIESMATSQSERNQNYLLSGIIL